MASILSRPQCVKCDTVCYLNCVWIEQFSFSLPLPYTVPAAFYTLLLALLWEKGSKCLIFKRNFGSILIGSAGMILVRQHYSVYYITAPSPAEAWAPSQYPKRRLFVRSRKVSKPRDWYFKLSYRFEIWQAHRQHCCRSACQISERSDNSKYKSRGFETLRDLTERRLFGYWDGAQSFCKRIACMQNIFIVGCIFSLVSAAWFTLFERRYILRCLRKI